MNEYIDTRGVWPTYIRGQFAVSLEGQPHTITVQEAREMVSKA